MEFGSLGLNAPQGQQQNTQTAPVADNATLQTNPENVVTPPKQGDPSAEDRRQDVLGRQSEDGLQDQPARGNSTDAGVGALSRRTTLNFDSEQNRVFLEVIDGETDEVIQRIPSEKFLEFVSAVLEPPQGGDSEAASETAPVDQSV
jgi:uncharacterized FlaG/YvyC family protein